MQNKKKFINKTLLVSLVILISFFSILLTIKNLNLSLRAISQSTSVSISIVTPPIVNITSPLNKTYNSYDINLSYSIISFTSISSCYFNLNNEYNWSIPNCMNFTFHAFHGSNTLNLYVNDSLDNLNKTSVTFFQNESYNFYYGNYSGSSTNLSSYTEQQLQNLSNFTLENPNWGKMFFLENVNISGDVNFDLYTNISFNKIEINISALNFLNKTAKLCIYNLTLSNPRISKDGVVCPSSICKIDSYSNGILCFNVTSFSTFQAEETPSSGSQQSSGSSSSGSSGGGGGTGQVVKETSSFVLAEDLLKVIAKPGSSISVISKIINNNEEDLNITLTVIGLGNFVRNKEQIVSVNARKDASFELVFDIPINSKTNAYVGKLIAKSKNIEKETLIILEIESQEPLFDVITKIEDEYKQVGSGGKIIAEVTIFNVKYIGLVDVRVDYELKDEDGVTVYNEYETRAIENQINFIKKINVPRSIKPGNYLLYVRTTYNDVTASSTNLIEVIPGIQRPVAYPGEFSIILLVIIFGVIILIVFLVHEHRKHKSNRHYKFNEQDLARFKLIKLKEEEEELEKKIKGGNK